MEEWTDHMAMLDGAMAQAVADLDGLKPASFIHVQDFCSYVKDGLLMAEPRELVPHILVEHETTILFGDTGLGKSTFAMQMAIDMIRREACNGLCARDVVKTFGGSRRLRACGRFCLR